jgi:Fur family transcriptional regulator, ferric uptake regulator
LTLKNWQRILFSCRTKPDKKPPIWKVIESSSRPLSAREIWERGRKQINGLGIATVYRMLRELGNEGQARYIEVPGAPPHYEITARSHHHFFFCEGCKKLLNLMGVLEDSRVFCQPDIE